MRSGTVLNAALHAPPPGWDSEAFERLTDAIAVALVAAVHRRYVGVEMSFKGDEEPE